MSRLFWVGVGAVAGFALSRKLTATARQATPAGLAENLGGALREMAGAIGAFGADVRAGMSEREDELQELVDRSTRGDVSPWERPAASRSRARSARARRAGG